MPIFRPSLVTNHTIRFDESLTIRQDQSPTPEALSPSDMANARQPVNVDAALGHDMPLVLQTGVENSSFVLNRVPKKGSVELTGFRQAWKFEFTYDFRDFPIDFRTIRSMGIEIHMGAVRDNDFANGMVHVDQDGQRTSIIRPSDDNLLFLGLVDEWDQEFAEGSGELKISGRDLRGFLLDTPMDAEVLANLDLSQPIDIVVRNILSNHPLAAFMRIAVRGDEWPSGTSLPSPGVTGDSTRVRVRPHHGRGPARPPRPSSRPRGGSQSTTFWDCITHYCFLVGALPHFIGKEIRIRPSRSIFELTQRAGFDPNIPTPFAGGALREVGDDVIGVREFVYGRNLKKLTFTRKSAGMTPRTVECVSIDTSSAERGISRLIRGQWPPGRGTSTDGTATNQDDDAAATTVAPSGQATQSAVLRVPVAGISSPDRLREIAKDVYEEVMRGEMGGSAETMDLASTGFNVDEDANTDPDSLRMTPGEAVKIVTDVRALSSNAPAVSPLIDSERRSFEEEVAAVVETIHDTNIARVIVATRRNEVIGLEPYFRVANVKYGWDTRKLSIAFDFQNYVQARSGVTRTANEQRSASNAGSGAQQQGQQSGGQLSVVEQRQARARLQQRLGQAAGNNAAAQAGLAPPGGAQPAQQNQPVRRTAVPGLNTQQQRQETRQRADGTATNTFGRRTGGGGRSF